MAGDRAAGRTSARAPRTRRRCQLTCFGTLGGPLPGSRMRRGACWRWHVGGRGRGALQPLAVPSRADPTGLCAGRSPRHGKHRRGIERAPGRLGRRRRRRLRIRPQGLEAGRNAGRTTAPLRPAGHVTRLARGRPRAPGQAVARRFGQSRAFARATPLEPRLDDDRPPAAALPHRSPPLEAPRSESVGQVSRWADENGDRHRNELWFGPRDDTRYCGASPHFHQPSLAVPAAGDALLGKLGILFR